MNSRQKGKRGEREWAAYLREQGYHDARRGQQFAGGGDSPDVVCDSLPIHWEVKRVEKLNVYDAMNQAMRDRGQGKVPVVAYRRNDHRWLVVMEADAFFAWFKEHVDVPTVSDVQVSE